MTDKTPAKSDKKEKTLVKDITPEFVRSVLQKYEATIDPSSILKEAAKQWTEYENAKGAKKKEAYNKLSKTLEHDATAIVALDNHYLMAETLDNKKYRILMIEVADQLIAEYGCKTATEKMLAQTASWAYCRMIEYSYKLNGLMRLDWLSSEKNGYYSMLSKEVDRCNRQYLSAISTLKHFKQPVLNVTFKANNAFVAQNQQVNAAQDGKPTEKNNAGQ